MSPFRTSFRHNVRGLNTTACICKSLPGLPFYSHPCTSSMCAGGPSWKRLGSCYKSWSLIFSLHRPVTEVLCSSVVVTLHVSDGAWQLMLFPLKAEVSLFLNRRIKALGEHTFKVSTHRTRQFLEAPEQGHCDSLNHFLTNFTLSAWGTFSVPVPCRTCKSCTEILITVGFYQNQEGLCMQKWEGPEIRNQ